ncbi:MAG: CoB--CoM heterodisulfide reductase subunit B [Thermoplasmata archaeon]|nr:MAG: CoB--CoM heterodisulfide reductase subunit B [Thermoplasmata archaeon]
MKAAAFLGCNVSIRRFEYEAAARAVAKKLDIEFVDSNDFGCCGYGAGPIDHDTYLAMAARNICVAEDMGVDLMMVFCSACSGNLTKVNKLLQENEEERKHINELLKSVGREFKGTVKIKHFTRFLAEDIGLERLKKEIVHPLEGVRIASHYGCHYIKPPEIFDHFEDPIHPHSMDDLVAVAGATPVNYPNKRQCCAGAIIAVSEDTSVKIVTEKLENLEKTGVDALAVHCPFCHVMYDEYQKHESVKLEKPIPVLFLPQILGLAMGCDPKKELGIKKKVAKKLLGGSE